MEHKTQNLFELLSSQLTSAQISQCNETKYTKNQLHKPNISKLLNLQELKAEKSALLSTVNNPKTERKFRKTCSSNKNNSNSSHKLNEAYQDFINAYHQITSLYLAIHIKNKTNLIIYDTEYEREELKVLATPERLYPGACIAQLPNGELFCYGNSLYSGITLILDSNLKFQLLPSGMPCQDSSAIYFNKSVYCFGGFYYNYKALTLSSRFDLIRNRWIQLIPLPQADFNCHTVIFKGDILISGKKNKNILHYSIDIGSFSIIPYEFVEGRRKILINTERLYLIECGYNWEIFESEVENQYAWKRISNSTISTWPIQIYCTYNKGGIYIGCFLKFTHSIPQTKYIKFSLNKKILIEE